MLQPLFAEGDGDFKKCCSVEMGADMKHRTEIGIYMGVSKNRGS